MNLSQEQLYGRNPLLNRHDGLFTLGSKAIDTCLSAVQVYLPCTAISPIDHSCLCEQHKWHVACYDIYASNAISRRDHATAEAYIHRVCLAAGNTGAATIERRHHRQRRQINNILNSVGGVVNSFLSSQSIGLAIPTAIPSLPAAPPARTTSQPTSAASTVRNSSPMPTTLSATASASISDAPQSTSTPPATSSPTSSTTLPGIIAGAVVGGVAALVLLGILVMLILRHKRKKRIPRQPTYYSTTLEDASHRSLDETLVDRTPMVEPPVPVGECVDSEKDVYRSSQQNVASSRHSEMETSANVWEIDGRERERPLPSELESPVAERGSPPWGSGREQRRDPRSELHF